MPHTLRAAMDRDRREAHWRQVLAAAVRSDLTQTDFCRSRGIEPANFFWWKGEIARRDAKKGDAIPPPRTPPVALVPVRLTERPTGGPTPIEVVLRGGRVLRVTSGFDADTLRRVVSILEEPC